MCKTRIDVPLSINHRLSKKENERLYENKDRLFVTFFFFFFFFLNFLKMINDELNSIIKYEKKNNLEAKYSNESFRQELFSCQLNREKKSIILYIDECSLLPFVLHNIHSSIVISFGTCDDNNFSSI